MSNEKRWDSAYEFKIMVMLSLAFGLVGLDRFILPPLFGLKSSTMAQDLGLNYQDLGNLVSILAICWGACAVLFGMLADRLGRRAVLVPAIVAFSVMSIFSGLATGLVSLFLIRALMGVAEGPVASTGVAVAVDASHPKRRGMNNGIFQCTISLFGNGFGPLIAAQLLAIATWRHVFFIVGIPGLIIAIIMWFVVREPAKLASERGGGTVQRAPLSQIFKHRNLPLAMVTLMCAMTGIFVLGAMMPSYLTDYLKLSDGQAAVISSAIGFGGALGQFGLLTVSDFIGRRLATLASYLVSAVFLWFFIHTGPNFPVLFALLFVTAMFNFGALAILAGPVGAEAAPAGLVASAAGLVIGAGEIFGGGVAPAIAGGIAQHSGIQYTLYFAMGGQVLGFLIALFLQETAPRRAKVAAGGSVSELDSAPGPG